MDFFYPGPDMIAFFNSDPQHIAAHIHFKVLLEVVIGFNSYRSGRILADIYINVATDVDPAETPGASRERCDIAIAPDPLGEYLIAGRKNDNDRDGGYDKAFHVLVIYWFDASE